ncbi:MAG: hypothetical protein COA97_02280 [Flavobacteriales bacterium]|nr:MAG: hypothetical protein COA97_02280 [Flavobacteriales bacterium]
MKHSIYFLIVFLLPFQLFSSIPDSLLIVANKEITQEKRIDYLNKSGVDFSLINIKKSDSILKLALKEAKNISYDYGVAMAYNNIGEMQFHSGSFDTAIAFINKAIPIRQKIKDYKGLGNSYLLFGEINRTKGNYQKATQYYITALEFMEKAKDKQGLASLKINLGLVYVAQKKYTAAKKKFKVAAKEFLAIGSIQHVADCYNNLAMVAYYENDYASTTEWLKKSLKIYTENNNTKGQATSYINIGATYSETKKFKEAEYHFKKGLAIYIQMKNKLYASVTRLNLGELYRKTKKYKKSQKYLTESLESFKQQDNKEYEKHAYTYLAALFEDQKEYKKAMEYMKLYNITKDSIINKANTTAIADMEAKYQGDAKQRSINEKEKEITQQKKLALTKNREKNIITFSGIAIVFIISIFAFLLYQKLKQSNTQKQIIEQKNNENELLLGEIHHRVKNNLQVISSLLSLQERNIEDKSAKAAILEGKERVKSMGLIHKLLYQNDNYSGVEMDDYVQKLTASLLDSFGMDETKFKLDIDFSKIKLDVDTAIPMGLIINELVINALKYAYKNTEKPALKLNLKKKKEELILEIADNGIGKISDLDNSKSFGMKLVKSLSRQLGGTLMINDENGLHVQINITDYKLV